MVAIVVTFSSGIHKQAPNSMELDSEIAIAPMVDSRGDHVTMQIEDTAVDTQ